jgi:hypothetical protein
MISAMIAAAVLQTGECGMSDRGEAETVRSFMEAVIRGDDLEAMGYVEAGAEVRTSMHEVASPVEDMLAEADAFAGKFEIVEELHVPNYVAMKVRMDGAESLAVFEVGMGCITAMTFAGG